MRILFTFVGGIGHYEPLVAIAQAAEARSHEVAFACRPSMTGIVEDDGFSAFATGPDVEDPSSIAPLAAPDAEREDRVLRDGFAGRTARRRAQDLVALCEDHRPDLVVSDEVDYGAFVAAERLDLVHATVLVLLTGSFARPGLLAGPLNELRAEHGLRPDPRLDMLSRHLVLAPFPPSVRDPSFPLPATAHCVRPAALERRPEDVLPPWVAGLGHKPTVYVTLGTIFNMESGDLFPRLLAGLRELPINLVATVGRQIDPDVFGAQPPHVHIERFIPQSTLLPLCDLVVSHGGSGSVIGALAHGLPMVLLPMGADQPHNARRCQELGLAEVLDPVQASPAGVRDATAAVLREASYRQRAEQMRAEIAALPDASAAMDLLERLVAKHAARVGTPKGE